MARADAAEVDDGYETIPCVVCGSLDSFQVHRHRQDIYLATARELGVSLPTTSVTWVICAACGLCYQNPRCTPAKFDEIYRDGYRRTEPRPLDWVEKSAEGRERAAWVNDRTSQRGEALDVGCGEGSLLRALVDTGWRGTGVEPSHWAVYAKEFALSTIHACTLGEANLPKEHFSLVAATHVLEHMPDPVAFAAQIGSYLRPDGYVFIEVPNLRRPVHSFRDFFPALHTYTYSPTSLTNVLSLAGLRVTHLELVFKGIRVLAQRTEEHRPIEREAPSQLLTELNDYKRRYLVRQQMPRMIRYGWRKPAKRLARATLGEERTKSLLEQWRRRLGRP